MLVRETDSFRDKFTKSERSRPGLPGESTFVVQEPVSGEPLGCDAFPFAEAVEIDGFWSRLCFNLALNMAVQPTKRVHLKKIHPFLGCLSLTLVPLLDSCFMQMILWSSRSGKHPKTPFIYLPVHEMEDGKCTSS